MESNKILADVFQTIRNDYAGFAEKQARHDPSPFVTMLGQAYYDHRMKPILIFQAMNQYCANLQDRNLKFTMDESEEYHPFSRGFSVRRSAEEGMFVDEVTAESALQVGDRVLTINRTAPQRIVETLPNPLLGADEAEREQWNGYLKLAEHIHVRHRDGSEEEVVMQRYPIAESAAPQCTQPAEGVVVLRFASFGTAEETQQVLDANATALTDCKTLVLDLRKNCGGEEEGWLPLLPYIVAQDTTLGEVCGEQKIRTNYTKMNCSRLIHNLQPFLQAEDESLRAAAREGIAYYRQMSGKGWVEEVAELPAEASTPIRKSPISKVVVLTDTWCENEAEHFVQLCKKQARARIVGRPTMGNVDYSNPVSVRYDCYTFTYPISKTEEAAAGQGVSGKGIAPDVLIPWTSRECTEDVLLQAALAE
jgi:C-terminal processing protease CtpA/Prc